MLTPEEQATLTYLIREILLSNGDFTSFVKSIKQKHSIEDSDNLIGLLIRLGGGMSDDTEYDDCDECDSCSDDGSYKNLPKPVFTHRLRPNKYNGYFQERERTKRITEKRMTLQDWDSIYFNVDEWLKDNKIKW